MKLLRRKYESNKFGGSSLASAPQLKKVLNIIKDDQKEDL